MAKAAHPAIEQQGGPSGLSRAFAGEHAWCADKLLLSEDLADGVPLPAFFRDGGFARAIDRYAEISGGSDRRAVISMWTLYYFSGLSIPYLIARRLAGQSLPVGFEDMTIALSENGLPRAFGVMHRGRTDDEGDDDCFGAVGPLIETHLGKAVATLKEHGISPRLCWNNAAVYIDYTLRLTNIATEPGLADLPLFVRGCLPDGGMNPFCGSIRHVEEEGECVTRRKVCCLRYMLPGVPSCGKLCALPEQRKQ